MFFQLLLTTIANLVAKIIQRELIYVLFFHVKHKNYHLFLLLLLLLLFYFIFSLFILTIS